MELFLTVEGQNAYENGLAQICYETQKSINFVTDKNENLKSCNNYGAEFQFISIIPSCVSDEYWNALGWKERIQIWRKKREADIRLRMDYDQFVRGSLEVKRLMYIGIVIKSIQAIQERSKDDFKGDKLICDILDALCVTKEQLKSVDNTIFNL